RFFVSLPCVFILDYPRFGRQTVFWGECLKIQKRQLTRNELVALNFPISGISLINMEREEQVFIFH
ncbi:hypothetical protein, partial [Bacteroides finegoldii]|uniref:hypothetical protein n=1 Tax=Bacteroides finegoldii TaxID=338188 RepID=UPI00319D9CED